MNDYLGHDRSEKNHRGKNNVLLFPPDYGNPARQASAMARSAGWTFAVLSSSRGVNNLAVVPCVTDAGSCIARE